MSARALESNNASPPQGGAIGEFLEQIVFMVHGVHPSDSQNSRAILVLSDLYVQFI
jgi:hypothetical protein